MELFGKIIKFECPTKSNIVIYEKNHSDNIIKYILKEYKYFIYNESHEKIMVCPLVIFIFFKSIILFDINMVSHSKDKLRAFFSQLLFCYRVSALKAIGPKVIVTMVDNSYGFHNLAKKYDGAEFFAIQNALRANYELRKGKIFHIPHYFTFGEYTEYAMTKSNHNILNYYPIGSLKLGIADAFFKHEQYNKYDIGIISQYRKNQDQYLVSDDKDILERTNSLNKMHSLLSKYISDTGRSAVMIMASDLDCEVDYYEKCYDNKIDYLFNNKEKMSSFGILYNCEVVVTFFSSLSVEALGIGRKTLRIDFTNGDSWNEYDNEILLKADNYHDVKERLNVLLKEPYCEYNERIAGYSKYLMNYDPDLPPHEYIRNKIKEYL